MAETNPRKERIEHLLRDLEYEVTRGIMEHDIEEEMGYRFMVPGSRAIPGGEILCEFRTRPMPRGSYSFYDLKPGLHVVGSDGDG